MVLLVVADWQTILTFYPVTSNAATLSPTFLGRARALTAEYAELSDQLAKNYDVQTAKKVGELSPTSSALSDWEQASSVSDLSKIERCRGLQFE